MEPWNKAGQRDVPPRGEGLDASGELRPYEEPGWRGKMRYGAKVRGMITRRVHHERIPLSHYRIRKGRHAQHRATEIGSS
jgi:hypothetical protein